MFIAFGRFLYVASIILIVLAGIVIGKESIIQKILAAKFWSPFAKISFAAYLVHPLVINTEIYSLNHGYYYSHSTILYSTLGGLI